MGSTQESKRRNLDLKARFWRYLALTRICRFSLLNPGRIRNCYHHNDLHPRRIFLLLARGDLEKLLGEAGLRSPNLFL